MPAPRLLAVSDLHVRYPENRAIVEALRPTSDGDWLIVAGDVAERVDDVVRTLALLRERFASVVWVPGNHELWTRAKEGVLLRGEERYHHLVQACRDHGVLTPEDPYPVCDVAGDDQPVAVGGRAQVLDDRPVLGVADVEVGHGEQARGGHRHRSYRPRARSAR